MRKAILQLNNLLFVLAVVFALYIVVAPLGPEVWYRAQPGLLALGLVSSPSETTFITYKAKIAGVAPRVRVEPDHPEGNVLYIPQIGVNGSIFEGRSVNILSKGIWHRPKTSTPDKGGNTVLVAHRFLYTTGPNTFYHLDKMEIGNQFSVFWDGKDYKYEVIAKDEVGPEALFIEQPTAHAQLTLWTCTPLFTAKKRLVIRAIPINL